MQFEWDEAKNEANVRKHGIDFADVSVVFLRPILTKLDDRTDYGEDRWITIGLLNSIIAVIVWTERQQDVIRIISARRANKYERKRYEDYLKDRLGSS